MKFNRSTRQSTVVENKHGAKSYTLSPDLDLYSAVVTSALADKFYESSDERLSRIRSLVSQVSPEFVAKLAVYAREQMYLRSIPLVLVVELAKIHSGDNLVSRTVARVVQRADEITELLSYYQIANNRSGTKQLHKLSKQIQRGLATAFNNFKEYQFAKYDRDTEVSLKDALFLVHPKAKDEAQQAIFNKIASDSLSTPDTWEVKMTEAGKSQKEKRVVWEELVAEEKLGYMALLRNLRNIIEAGVSQKTISSVCTKLSDAEEVRKSKQFPFRFLSAYEEVQQIMSPKTSIVIEALEKAIQVSAENIDGFNEEESVFIACDVSGSMDGKTISERSKVRIKSVGLVLAMLLRNRCKSVMTGAFADRFAVFNLPANGILSNTQALDSLRLGGNTNGYLAIKALIDNKIVVDRVMFFTDCQLWDSRYFGTASLADYWHEYKKIVPHAKLYMFDLAGYGQTPLSTVEKDVYYVAGWSDRIFQVLDAIEHGSSALKVIESIEL